jgi:hypothetical protein
LRIGGSQGSLPRVSLAGTLGQSNEKAEQLRRLTCDVAARFPPSRAAKVGAGRGMMQMNDKVEFLIRTDLFCH